MSVSYAIYSKDEDIQIRPRFASYTVGRPLFIVRSCPTGRVLIDALTLLPVCEAIDQIDSIKIIPAGFFANINTTLRLDNGIWTFECCNRILKWVANDSSSSLQCDEIATFSLPLSVKAIPRIEPVRTSWRKSKPENIKIHPFLQSPSPPVTPTLPSPLVSPPTPGLFSPLSPLSSPSKTFSYAQEVEAEGFTELGTLDISELALNQKGGRALEIILVMGLTSILGRTPVESIPRQQAQVREAYIPIEISF